MTHGSKFVLIPRSSAERKGWIQVWDDVCVRNIWSRHLFFSLRERESGKSFPEGWDEGAPKPPCLEWNEPEQPPTPGSQKGLGPAVGRDKGHSSVPWEQAGQVL